ncbi:hypothetical protein [Catelliglobosispora koreensis]|uniref:hypothetical protein n=1 Tax=Catelliglobosispora koreensis TaxID=129052 RepID=UPI0003820856|nr:hypothetical protein [Catelliglobosispora koreensis]
MSDVQKLSLTVLHTVAEFLALLPAEHLDDLAAGAARLAIIPKDSSEPLLLATAAAPKRASTRSAPKPPPAPAPEIVALVEQLDSMETREGAQALLKGVSAANVKKMAVALGIGAAPSKADNVTKLVEFTVGNKLNSAAIRQL